jgi:glycosyltransferase involved in cell wall biosynthesis
MTIAFIIRSTFQSAPGGDTIQVEQTARALRILGVNVDIIPTSDKVEYEKYNALHFFNIHRPADILYHIGHTKKPYFISPILVDYSEYDKKHRKGLTGLLLSPFSPPRIEYIKTVSRWISGKDSLRSKKYIWQGQRKTIRKILQGCAAVLPNSMAEYKAVTDQYGIEKPFAIIPNGVDRSVFKLNGRSIKKNNLVLCAARIEGIKNQLNLIRAMNDTKFTLMLIGSPAPNQKKYYRECKNTASANVIFEERISQDELALKFREAKVHVLPSWFETCGLSSLEAAAMGCNIVITDKGFTRDYFGTDAFYCEPGVVSSIYKAIEKASESEQSPGLRQKIENDYTWEIAAKKTLETYKKLLPQ